MALFDRFRRKSEDLNKVDNYYATPRRSNPILALLLGVATFLITLAVIWLLFIGGRWVYRQITNDDSSKNQTQTSQNGENGNQENKTGENNAQGNQGGNTSSTSTNKPSGSTNQQSQQNSGSQSSTTQGGSSAQSTPALGDTPMPRTGDEGL